MNVEQVPKVELHCHLDGIADPATLRAIQASGQELAAGPEALEAYYPVSGYDSFLRWADAHQAFEGDIDAFRPILAIHLERLKAQNVVYTEIMVGTSELPEDRGELLDNFRAFRDWLTAEEDGRVQVELLVALNRRKPVDVIAEVVERVLLLHEERLVAGVALAGIEAGNPVKPLRRCFERLHDAGLGIEIHAGEWAGPESVGDALEHGFPSRIGHGVAAFADPGLIEHIRERGIHLELCPTSNVKTGSIRTMREHPAGRAKEMGLSFSINTDDPGAFQTSMTDEFRLMEEEFGFTQDDFDRIRRDALAARFRPDLRYGAA